MNDLPLIIDAHLDLSMNALEWNRDLRWEIKDIRDSEHGMTDKPDRGKNTVSFGAMRKGNVRICVATQIARYVKRGSPIPGWNSPEQAWAQTQGQLAWYRAMEEAGEMVQISCREDLARQLENIVINPEKTALGYILSLEGADSIVTISHLERAWEYGLRAVGPAHYGPGRYAFGTDSHGGLGKAGRELLNEMDRLGMILDVTHLCDESFYEAMSHYRGPLWASHNNCRKFVPHNRQFSDEQIVEITSRNGVVCAALDAWMLVPGWKQGISEPVKEGVRLQLVADNIDHVCQLTGDSLHAAIGSDLDGAFGKEQSPVEIDTIADLQKLAPLLKAKGFSGDDIINIFSGNLIRFLSEALPVRS